jgi:hypothetical protein
MGRVLKRVPLKFDWPIGKVWKGYINPYYKKCRHCDNGETIDYKWLHAATYIIGMLGNEAARPRDEIHPWLQSLPLAPEGRRKPTKEMAKLTTGLAGRAPDGVFGHDAIDQWRIMKKVIKAAGMPKDWGVCPYCKGTGIDAAHLKEYNRWRPKEPPKGVGYQLWETTSEGSPESPVFRILDELCEWCETNAFTFASFRATKEEWKQMLSEDFVCHVEGNMVFR